MDFSALFVGDFYKKRIWKLACGKLLKIYTGY